MVKLSNEKLIARIDELIKKGRNLLNYESVPPEASITRFSEWRTGSESFLARFLGREDNYFKEFANKVTHRNKRHIREGIGILSAVKEDIEKGYLLRIKGLISAELFDSFLDQAEYLLNEDYKDAAAVLIGGVLEITLKQICDREGANYGKRDGINELNQSLYTKGVYNKLRMKQIKAWTDIRNSAAHADYGEYTEEDVKDMFEGVKRLIAENF